MTRTGTRLVLMALLLVSLALAALLAARAVGTTRSAHAGEEGIRPWMSVPYIAHSQGVPQRTLWDALEIAPHVHDHRSLTRIAKEKKKRVEELIDKLHKAIGSAHSPPKESP